MHSASQPTLLPSALTRNRLTPRSAEACRRTGIEPAELLPVPQSAFQETGQPADVEKIRWERYEELRMDAYKAIPLFVLVSVDTILGQGFTIINTLWAFSIK